MKKLFNIILILFITSNVMLPQKLNAYFKFKNDVNIFFNLNSFKIKYKNFQDDNIFLIFNDKDHIPVEVLPYKIIDGWKYYNLYHDNTIRSINGKRVFELRTTDFIQFYDHPHDKEMIITFYDSSELKIKF